MLELLISMRTIATLFAHTTSVFATLERELIYRNKCEQSSTILVRHWPLHVLPNSLACSDWKMAVIISCKVTPWYPVTSLPSYRDSERRKTSVLLFYIIMFVHRMHNTMITSLTILLCVLLKNLYQNVWAAVVGEEPPCQRVRTNSQDPFVVAMMKGETNIIIVGNLEYKLPLSAPCFYDKAGQFS